MIPEILPDPSPVNAEDALLARFLEEAFDRYVRGEAVRPAELLAHQPRLIPAGVQLLADARDLFRAALGLRGRSRLLRSELFEQTAEFRPAPAEPPDQFLRNFVWSGCSGKESSAMSGWPTTST